VFSLNGPKKITIKGKNDEAHGENETRHPGKSFKKKSVFQVMDSQRLKGRGESVPKMKQQGEQKKEVEGDIEGVFEINDDELVEIPRGKTFMNRRNIFTVLEIEKMNDEKNKNETSGPDHCPRSEG
jgi:hypothetical protein